MILNNTESIFFLQKAKISIHFAQFSILGLGCDFGRAVKNLGSSHHVSVVRDLVKWRMRE